MGGARLFAELFNFRIVAWLAVARVCLDVLTLPAVGLTGAVYYLALQLLVIAAARQVDVLFKFVPTSDGQNKRYGGRSFLPRLVQLLQEPGKPGRAVLSARGYTLHFLQV